MKTFSFKWGKSKGEPSRRGGGPEAFFLCPFPPTPVPFCWHCASSSSVVVLCAPATWENSRRKKGKHHRLFLLLLPLRGKRRLRKSFVAFPLPPKSALAPFPLLRPRRRPTSSFLPLDQLFHPSLVSERGAFLVGPIRPRPSSPLSFSFSPGQTFLRSTASLSSVALMAVRTCKELGVGFHHFEKERKRTE